MAVLASSNIAGHHIGVARFSLRLVVVVLSSALLRPFDEVVKVLVSQSQTVIVGTGWNVRFEPYKVIAQYPSCLLKCDGNSRWNEEQVLLLPKAPHRSLSAKPIAAAKPLPAFWTNARPTGEVGITDVQPEAARLLKRPRKLVQNADKVGDIPFRHRLQAEHTTMCAIPLERRPLLRRAPKRLPLLQDAPIVLHTIGAQPPIGRTGDDQINRARRQEINEIVGIALHDLRRFYAPALPQET